MFNQLHPQSEDPYQWLYEAFGGKLPLRPNKYVEIRVGDCLDVLRRMPDESVHCVVTSPPYWGLRDYGVEGQLGMESTPEAFVASMVAVFREVRRVLRSDGTCWLNIGDTYNSPPPGANPGGFQGKKMREDLQYASAYAGTKKDYRESGLKNKDLALIPFRLALALQLDGWYIRQDIIWHKPNPMPESVKDRPTTAHEHVFLMSKSERYHYDWQAIAEPFQEDSARRIKREAARGMTDWYDTDKYDVVRADAGKVRRQKGSQVHLVQQGRNRRSVWSITSKPFKGAHFATFPPDLAELCIKAGCPENGVVLDPFFGAGTTGVVASWHMRRCIGIELNEEYALLAEHRIRTGEAPVATVETLDDLPLFAGIA